ncbi:TPA: hypothetical protein ACG3DC_002552, partial [Stenotrophomonas maltophilia]|nr:hypothetical protein [Stenotrophomonas maltophilia]
LGRGIHAADTPATGPAPASDRFRVLLVGVDLGRHGRSTPCVDESLSGIEKRMASDLFFNEKGHASEQH